ncbi:SDR family NAD(P)-dependent oxidoreductase [Paracoccus litorisediminis]|jgi:NAD(P)-dependent dehydrogenase (short-subunit alcohol dehydrogenase family)|uniref:SDR family NAD(P)-dependent oxidoreductase n=1 Tax=Paracoccus litorisediminis TaxID=2006130 RepID=A0A844HRX2_9RHOB|nr:SDR family NAD(P)-dependent oxidoreductase [Paracoccus litorisediminis]MTH62566.1 SDR family NAD(P)-dependent oxidoreductase [Paracoccus litorisediminis]
MRALVLGHTGGIGSAVADELRARGGLITGLSRREGLDLTQQDSVARAARALQAESFDLIFDATGALEIDGHRPEKTIAAIRAEAMAAQFALNATGTALALAHFSPLLVRQRRAVFASLSARVGSIGDNRLGGWISYRAAKAAQNQILRTAAIELARRNRQTIVVALHPGTVRTRLTARYAAHHPTISPDESARALLDVIETLTPEDNGSFRDWRGEPVEW